MDPNCFLDLMPETRLVAVGSESFFVAQHKVIGCEACDAASATSPFSAALDGVTQHQSGSLNDYVLSEPAKCGRCGSGILEGTLVVLEPESKPHFSPVAHSVERPR